MEDAKAATPKEPKEPQVEAALGVWITAWRRDCDVSGNLEIAEWIHSTESGTLF